MKMLWPNIYERAALTFRKLRQLELATGAATRSTPVGASERVRDEVGRLALRALGIMPSAAAAARRRQGAATGVRVVRGS